VTVSFNIHPSFLPLSFQVKVFFSIASSLSWRVVYLSYFFFSFESSFLSRNFLKFIFRTLLLPLNVCLFNNLRVGYFSEYFFWDQTAYQY
jgi:hypothetical protein